MTGAFVHMGDVNATLDVEPNVFNGTTGDAHSRRLRAAGVGFDLLDLIDDTADASLKVNHLVAPMPQLFLR